MKIIHKRKLAVIGGGMAGHRIAYAMRGLMDVTLIDPKTYFEIPMALPRLLVDPGSLPARIPYAGLIPHGRHIQGRAESMTDRSMCVSLGPGVEVTVEFDYAVIATGSRSLDPLIKAEAPDEATRAAEIESFHARVKAARRIVLVGGGPVGVETAAELRETFPDLPVTLIHAGPTLLENAPSKFGVWARAALEAGGVEIFLGERVMWPIPGSQPPDGEVRTDQGRGLQADAVIWATGTSPTTGFVARSWPELVDGHGRIEVDDFLRLRGHPTIFAAGDVTSLPEGRLGLIADFHARSITRNLAALARASSSASARLRPYKPKGPGSPIGRMMIVTLGRRDGLTSLPFGQFRAPILARNIKSKDMLVGRYRDGVGM